MILLLSFVALLPHSLLKYYNYLVLYTSGPNQQQLQIRIYTHRKKKKGKKAVAIILTRIAANDREQNLGHWKKMCRMLAIVGYNDKAHLIYKHIFFF